MQDILPEKSAEISEWIEHLPYNETSLVYPWSGVVVNANIATRAHRDPGDDGICMVVTVSDCVGGEIVLFELGLVIELRSGDAIIFRSTDQTHFNLDFNGLRASLVFHSDNAGKSWNQDRNGWNHNQYFS
jgi:hypothetical protein